MTKDLKEFYLALSVFVLLFIIMWFSIKMLRQKLSRWHELAADFPATDTVPETKLFKYCPGQAGRISFSGKNYGFAIGFIPMGIFIKSKLSGQPDLLVPWTKIRSASKFSLHSKDVAKIEIDSLVPLNFTIAGDALSAFETWHYTEIKTLDQFIDKARAKRRT